MRAISSLWGLCWRPHLLQNPLGSGSSCLGLRVSGALRFALRLEALGTAQEKYSTVVSELQANKGLDSGFNTLEFSISICVYLSSPLCA